MVDLIHALFDQKNEGKSQQRMVFHTPHSNIHSNIQKNSNQIDQTMKLTYTNQKHCILLREALPSVFCLFDDFSVQNMNYIKT